MEFLIDFLSAFVWLWLGILAEGLAIITVFAAFGAVFALIGGLLYCLGCLCGKSRETA